MNDTAIRVDNLSKLYQLGALNHRSDTLRDAMVGMFRRVHQSANSESTNPDDLWALHGVSFEAKRGEVVRMLGYMYCDESEAVVDAPYLDLICDNVP